MLVQPSDARGGALLPRPPSELLALMMEVESVKSNRPHCHWAQAYPHLLRQCPTASLNIQQLVKLIFGVKLTADPWVDWPIRPKKLERRTGIGTVRQKSI